MFVFVGFGGGRAVRGSIFCSMSCLGPRESETEGETESEREREKQKRGPSSAP